MNDIAWMGFMKIGRMVILILFLGGCATKSLPVSAEAQKSLYILDCGRYAEVKDELHQKAEEATNLLLNSGTIDSKARVAVIDFVELSGNTSDFDRYIVEEFINNLASRRVNLVDRRLLGKVLDELKLNNTDLFNPRFSMKFGELTGARFILTGTTIDVGSSVRINARLIETETGRIMATAVSEVQKTVSICKMFKQNLIADREKKSYMPSHSSQADARDEKGSEKLSSPANDGRSQRIKYMEVRLLAFEKLTNGDLRVTMRIFNNSRKQGLGVALKAVGSDGIADFWKFMPTSASVVTDEAGNKYPFSSASGMGYARTDADWTVLAAGESVPVSIEFRGNKGYFTQGNDFTLSIDIWLAWRDEPSPQVKTGYFNVYLPHLGIESKFRK